MIDDMGSKILKALLPIMEDKKVTNNRLSREKAAKRQSFVQSSVFGQMEVDINEDEPEVPVKGSYVYNAAKPELPKRSPLPLASPLKPKAKPEGDKQLQPPVIPDKKGKLGSKGDAKPSDNTKTKDKGSGSVKPKLSSKGDKGFGDNDDSDVPKESDQESSDSKKSDSKSDEIENDYHERVRNLREVRENARNKSGPNYVNVQASTIQFGRQVQVQKEQDKFKSEYILRDLTTRSIIMFANRYMTYRTGLLAPASIQKCMDEDVKNALQASPKGRKWNMHGTNNFENMSADEMIIFLKDYVSPISSLDYYNKLNDAVQFPHFSSKFDIHMTI
jgi:hypothetical protein